MWNLSSASKLTEQRSRQRTYELHRQRLHSMKALLKMKEPIQPQFVYTKPKKDLSRVERLQEIDRDNQILLEKIQRIQNDGTGLQESKRSVSKMNKYYREADRVFQENRRICEKLLKVGSFYPTNKILEKTDQLQQMGYNISENARRAASARQRTSSSWTGVKPYNSLQSQRAVTAGRRRPQTAKESEHRLSRPQSAPCFKRSPGPHVELEESSVGYQ